MIYLAFTICSGEAMFQQCELTLSNPLKSLPEFYLKAATKESNRTFTSRWKHKNMWSLFVKLFKPKTTRFTKRYSSQQGEQFPSAKSRFKAKRPTGFLKRTFQCLFITIVKVRQQGIGKGKRFRDTYLIILLLITALDTDEAGALNSVSFSSSYN